VVVDRGRPQRQAVALGEQRVARHPTHRTGERDVQEDQTVTAVQRVGDLPGDGYGPQPVERLLAPPGTGRP
jgi:hypothetical protein